MCIRDRIFLLFLIWRRDFASLKSAKLGSGILLFLLVGAPWYVAMAIKHPDFLSGFIGTQNFLRATVSEHPRDNVIWYYTAVNLLNAYAWIGLLPGALKAYLWKDCLLYTSLYGLLGLYLVTWGGRKLYGEKVGFFSGVFLLMTLQFFTISKSVLTDGMLFLFLNGALLFFCGVL